MKKLSLAKDTLVSLHAHDAAQIAGGVDVYSEPVTCTSPDDSTYVPTVCRIFTDQSYCNTQKCPTAKYC